VTATAALGIAPQVISKPQRLGTVRLLCIIFLALMLAMAIFGPYFMPYSPTQVDILAANQPPSSAHWLGTDALGRDIATLVVYGARWSLIGPAIVVAAAALVGSVLALTAVWFGGRVDGFISRCLDIVMAAPSLLLAIVLVAMLGTGAVAPLVALVIGYAPWMARSVRAVAVRERHLPYIEACQMAGLSVWRINRRHMLPNVRSVIGSQSAFMYGSAMVDLAALSFIGLGVQPPSTEWGLLIAQSRTGLLNGQVLGVLVPGLLIVLVVIAVNLIGASITKDVDR